MKEMDVSNDRELREEIQRLSLVVEEMRGRLSHLEGGGSADGESNRSSRRRFLTLGAGAALGAIGLAAGSVLPAAATDGDTVTVGATKTGEHPTVIQGDAATAVPVFAAKAQGFVSADQAAAGTFAGPLQGLGANGGTGGGATAVDGVDGWAEGDLGFGVWGLTDSGVGTVGESSTGVSLYARASGRILQDPRTSANASGMPDFAANDFELVRDTNGRLWLSIPGGGWVKPGINPFPDPRRVVAQATVSNGLYGPFDATTKVGGGASGVPAGASAAWCAVQSYTPGVLTLYPDGTPDTHIANYSGTGTQGSGLNMLYMLVPLSSAGKFRIHSYITGNVYVDVWGFLY
jgi:hypothetical protein